MKWFIPKFNKFLSFLKNNISMQLVLIATIISAPIPAQAKVIINGVSYTVTYLLGDSLTDGQFTYGQEHLGGYRGVLYEELKKMENPLFVGTTRANSLPLFPMPAAEYSYHDGHPGFRLDQLQVNLPFWSNNLLSLNEMKVAPENVDRVLVMGGTNDIFQGADAAVAFGRFFSLIYGPGLNNEFPANPKGLLTTFPNAKIFVATIPPLYVFPGGLVKLGEPEVVTEYNAAIRANIQQVKTNNPAIGNRIELVDQYNALLPTNAFNPYITGSIIPVGDGIHPNSIMVNFGYTTMAETWVNAIVKAY